MKMISGKIEVEPDGEFEGLLGAEEFSPGRRCEPYWQAFLCAMRVSRIQFQDSAATEPDPPSPADGAPGWQAPPRSGGPPNLSD